MQGRWACVTFAAVLLAVSDGSPQINQCGEAKFEIREIADDGSTIRLEFGSLWIVEASYRSYSRAWLRL